MHQSFENTQQPLTRGITTPGFWEEKWQGTSKHRILPPWNLPESWAKSPHLVGKNEKLFAIGTRKW